MTDNDAMTVMLRESRVRHGEVWPVFEGREVEAGFHRLNSQDFLLREKGFACRYRKGEGITVQLDDPAMAGTLALYLAGTVHSAIAAMNGYTALHASAIEAGGVAIAFTGAPGAGKSTTAAGLRSLGFPIVADDTLVVDMTGGTPMCLPGHKRLKLWPDSVELTGMTALEVVSEDYRKFFATENGSEVDRALPLCAIVALAVGDDLAFEAVRGAERITALDDDHYTAEHRVLVQGQDRKSRLMGIVELANAVPMFRFVRPLATEHFARTNEFLAAKLAELRALQ